MKKYVLFIILALCALSALAVAFLNGKGDNQEKKEIEWKYLSMRSVCYMSVECVTPDFSPVQESIYANRLMYGELPMSFILNFETNADSVQALTCLVECENVKMEADLKELKLEASDSSKVCSGIFVYNLSELSSEIGVPAVMNMMRVFPDKVAISIKPTCNGKKPSKYIKVKKK